MQSTADWVLGYTGGPLVAVGDGVYAYASASGIATASANGGAKFWAPGDGSHNITSIAVNRRRTQLVCAERRLKVNLLLYPWPDMRSMTRFPEAAELAIADMDFSRDGSRLAVLADAPAHNLSLFRIEPGEKPARMMVQRTPNEVEYTSVSFSPWNNTDLCASGGGQATMWKFDENDTQHSLTPTECIINGRVRVTCHTWGLNGCPLLGTSHGTVRAVDPNTGKTTLLLRLPGEVPVEGNADLDPVSPPSAALTPRASEARSGSAPQQSDLGELVEQDASGADSPNVETGIPPTRAPPVAALAICAHHLLALTEDGALHFCSRDGSRVDATLQLPLSDAATLAIDPSWTELAVGGRGGQILRVKLPDGYETTLPEQDVGSVSDSVVMTLLNVGGDMASGCFLSQSQVAVVSRVGDLRVLDVGQHRLVNRMSVGAEPECIAAADGRLIVGSGTGTIRIVDPNVGVVTRCKVLQKGRFVQACPCPQGSRVLLVSDLRHIVVFDVHSQVPDAIVEVPALMDRVYDVCWLTPCEEENDGNPPSEFFVSTAHGAVVLLRAPPPEEFNVVDRIVRFEDVFVNLWRIEWPMLRLGVAASFIDSIHLFGAAVDRDMRFFIVDRTLAPERKDRDTKAAKLSLTYKDHDKPVSDLHIAGRIMVTAGTDGRLSLRDIGGLQQSPAPVKQFEAARPLHQARSHVSLDGGIGCVALSPDATRLLTCGRDGALIMWRVGHPIGNVPPPAAFTVAPEAEVKANAAVDPEEEHHFVQREELAAEQIEFARTAAHRAEVVEKVAVLRDQIIDVRTENNAAADDEKVDPEEFLIDRERVLFGRRCETAIAEMRDDVKWTNLYNDYVAQKIKTECWESMQTKLAPLYALKRNVVVHNFHTCRREEKDFKLLRRLKFLRRVEELDRHRRDIHELESIVVGEGKKEPAVEEEGTEADSRPPLIRIIEERRPVEGVVAPQPTLEEEAKDSIVPHLYRAVMTFTRHRAITQIYLLNAAVAAEKRNFNDQFDAMARRKQQDLRKMAERNTRSVVIQKELGEEEELPQFESRPDEDPAILLAVPDEDIKADRTHDPDEVKRRAAEAAERERFLRQHGSDDAPQRALHAWMGGRLEKEVIVLKAHVDMPDFMDENHQKFVAPEDRNEDQQRLEKEYEKALAKRVEEVEAQRSALRAELDELQKANRKCVQDFDADMQALLLVRLAAAQKVAEVDLRQVKLVQGLVLEEDRAVVLGRLERQRAALESKLEAAVANTASFRNNLASKRQLNEGRDVSAKQIESHIKSASPWVEHPELIERLLKLYNAAKRKKAGRDRRGKETKTAPAASGDQSAAEVDPFAFIEREADEKRRADLEEEAQATAFISRLEQPEYVPEGSGLWEAFMDHVRDRTRNELEVKRTHDEIAVMERELQQLSALESGLREAAADSSSELQRFQTQAIRDRYDIDEPRLFRQGQVEVEQAAVVTDYANAVLIDTYNIDGLNQEIRKHGGHKVEKMLVMNKERLHIRHIEWEIDMVRFETETLGMQYRHLHTLRVTKQMQEFLNGGGEGHNERERHKLQQKIDHVQTTTQARLEDAKRQMQRLKRQVRDKEVENSQLLDDVVEAQTLVEQRRSIRELQSAELDKERSERLMRDMRVTRKLEDVAKAQQEELAALKREVDRLRERTFPSFAVVSKRVIGNPDEM